VALRVGVLRGRTAAGREGDWAGRAASLRRLADQKRARASRAMIEVQMISFRENERRR
jgi:hypothetical protein